MGNRIEENSPEYERLEKLKKEFKSDFEADKEWREQRTQCLDFYFGRQWTEEELQTLLDRAQPATVRNRIKPKIDAMVGVELALKVNTKAIDRGTRDFDKALHISEALRLIEDDNDFDTTEAKAFADTIKCGRAWYYTEIDWVDFEAFTKISKLSNNEVIPDRHGRNDDLSDWKRLHHTIFMDVEDAIDLWPDFEDELKAACFEKGLGPEEKDKKRPHKTILGDQYNNPDNHSSTIFVDDTQQRVRVIRTWYRENTVKKFLTHPDIGTEDISQMSRRDVEKAKEMFVNAREWTKIEQTMNYVTFVDNAILEDEKNVRPHDKSAKYPFVLVPGWYDEEKGYHIGMVPQMIDPQKEVNKRSSKMLHILNTRQIIAEKGAVEDKNKFRHEATRPDGYMEIARPGARVEVNTSTDIAMSQFQLLQEAKGEIDAAGAAQELIGQSQASSGKEFQLRQQAAIQPIRELFLNLRGARRRVALLCLDDIQQFWRGERWIKLTDDPASGMIELNKRTINPITGQVEIVNDVSVGRYDIKIEEAQDTPNLSSETFGELVKLANAGMPIPPDMLIEMSPLPNKRKLLQRFQQQQAQQPMLPNPNQGGAQ